MNAHQAVARLANVIRRKHLALKTEQSYSAWLRRFCQPMAMLPADMPSENDSPLPLKALARAPHDSTIYPFHDSRPKKRQSCRKSTAERKFHFAWRRSPHVVFGHCPGLDWLRSTRQLSSKSPAKAKLNFEPLICANQEDRF